ncbi:MAG: sulfatase-like hydrolase/transferase [Theionarchaea archaeon]|nr:sulfatase-like hydrolase/transferase [Theionarchaea archaeon]
MGNTVQNEREYEDGLSSNNVILITIDCLRADHVGCYGYTRETTPFIDSLARTGMVFTHFFSNGPFTSAAFPAILSSSYALDNGKYISLKGRTLVGEILQKEGITTAGIHSNPYLSSQCGYYRGFDYFEDCMTGSLSSSPSSLTRILQKGNTIIDSLLKSQGSREIKSMVKNYITLRHEPFVSAQKITTLATKWIESIGEHPFFLWIHYMDIHEPYVILNTDIEQRDSSGLSRFRQSQLLSNKKAYLPDIISVYDDKLRYIDSQIKRLHHVVTRKTGNPLCIITSDHGQEFYEHGDFGHKAKYYDEILHIPLIIHGASGTGVSDTMRSQVDIAPTILELYGVESPSHYQGSSLLSDTHNECVISESSHDEHRKSLVESHSSHPYTSYACRTRQWKYIYQFEEEGLYFLGEDPAETCNVAQNLPHSIRDLRDAVDHHKYCQAHREKERIDKSIKQMKSTFTL